MLHTLRLPFFGALVAGALLSAACGSEDAMDDTLDPSALSADALERADGTDGGEGKGKVTICHIPPGNPANAHTITVGAPAVRAHVKHGDTLGACGSTAPDAGSEPTPDSGGGEPTPDAGTEEPAPICVPENGTCVNDGDCCAGLDCTNAGTCVPVLD